MRALVPLSAVALCALVLIACDEATEPPFLAEVSPTPTAGTMATPTVEPTVTGAPETPTPPPECDGIDCFRAFAVLIDAALAENDASFFADRGVEDEITCTGDEQIGPCMDQTAGTVVRGISYAIAQSEGTFLSPDDYTATLADWFAAARPDLSDEYGSGGLTLYALGHRPATEGSEEAYLAIVTGIFTSGPDAFRQARIPGFRFLDGQWRLTADLLATAEFIVPDFLSGECDICYDHWERWEGGP